MKPMLLLLLLVILIPPLSCDNEADEEDYTSGLILQSEKDYLKMEQAKMARSFSEDENKLYKNLPDAVDLAQALPEPGDQKKQNSCTAWSLAYSIKSFQENREHDWGLDQSTLFSPSFIYNQINGGKDEGADLEDAMKFVKKNGVVTIEMMPYNSGDFTTQPDAKLISLAKGFRILDYRRIDEKNLNIIKAYLAAGEPVLLVIKMHQNFLTRGMKKNRAVYNKKSGRFLGHHAIVAVGYNDTKQALKLLNSWGKRWGENGFGWLDYDFLKEVAARGYVVYDAPTPQKAVAAIKGTPKDAAYALQDAAHPPADTVIASRSKDKDKIIAGAAADNPADTGLENTLLVVPNEGGMFYQDQYVRLGDQTKAADVFLSHDALAKNNVVVNEDMFNKGHIGQMIFYESVGLPVYTNEGITFGMHRKSVRRTYGKPDAIAEQPRSDTYFFHTIAADWGGVSLVRNATLTIGYDQDFKITRITLANVFKKIVKDGSFYVAINAGEKKDVAGKHRINAPLGDISFEIAKELSEIKKADWGETGMGYFIKDPSDPQKYIAVKIFKLKDAITPDSITKRIHADLGITNTAQQLTSSVKLGGLDFTAVKGNPYQKYYGGRGNFIYQIEILAPQNETNSGWAGQFLKSIEVR
ncbi:MAG: C1 family peptidase [Deltaproteobacteria bacterium]|nr:C1 family peptidase [Deltaproteobacteria bacterium]